MASILDPLGTAAPLIAKAKIRLKSLGVIGVNLLVAVDNLYESLFAIVRQLINTCLDRRLYILPKAGIECCLLRFQIQQIRRYLYQPQDR